MILAFCGEKGGTGKTTCAVNIAIMRILADIDTLLVDTDKQRSASNWCLLRDDNGLKRLPSVQKFDKSIKNEVRELASKYQDVIIDAGGRDSTELRSTLLVADRVIIPIRPSQFDLWTLQGMNSLVEIALEYNDKLKAYVLINQCSTNPKVKETLDAVEYIKENNLINLNILKTNICERVIYRKSSMTGTAVIEFAEKDQKANEEMNSLYKEIFNV